jgi:transcriptional regulator with XRE-family HTH domain
MSADDLVEHIGPFISARRAELGLSLEQVAERAGTTKSHIWELEKGRSRNPTISMAIALCDALQCSLNSLLGRDVSQPQFSDQEMALIAAHRAIFGKSI